MVVRFFLSLPSSLLLSSLLFLSIHLFLPTGILLLSVLLLLQFILGYSRLSRFNPSNPVNPLIEIEVKGTPEEIQETLQSILRRRLYRMKKEKFEEGVLLEARRRTALWRYRILSFGFLLLLFGSALSLGFGYRKVEMGREGDFIPLPRSQLEVRIEAFTVEYQPDGQLKEVKTTLTFFDKEARSGKRESGRRKSIEFKKSREEAMDPESLFTVEISSARPVRYTGLVIRQGGMVEELAKALLRIRKGGREEEIFVGMKSESGDSARKVPFSKDLLFSIGGFRPETPAIRIDLSKGEKQGAQSPKGEERHWLPLMDSLTTEGGVEFQFRGYLPRLSTEIIVERNPGIFSALFGGGVVIFGILFSLLLPHRHLWVKITPSSRNGMSKVLLGGPGGGSKRFKREAEGILKRLLISQHFPSKS